jgi:predicted NAD-dependent protein-ADP-ribosyltransferase YbiA (DUF1768 family)
MTMKMALYVKHDGETGMSNSRLNMPINFYNLREPYGEFSNFAPYPITFKGHRSIIPRVFK